MPEFLDLSFHRDFAHVVVVVSIRGVVVLLIWHDAFHDPWLAALVPIIVGKFELSNLLAGRKDELLDIFGGRWVDRFDDQLGIVKMGQSLFQMAQARCKLGVHGERRLSVVLGLDHVDVLTREQCDRKTLSHVSHYR
jgi:hypothetical protein